MSAAWHDAPRAMSEPTLSHIATDGTARMVDVGAKPVTPRMARAEGFVRISPELERQVRDNTLAKGSLLEVARLPLHTLRDTTGWSEDQGGTAGRVADAHDARGMVAAGGGTSPEARP